MKPLSPPSPDLTFPAQVEPMAARLLKGVRTVVIETAAALQVAFGADRRAALTAATAVGAAVISATHGPAVVTLAVPEGATHVALVLATDSPQAASLAARTGARLVSVKVSA